MTSKFILRALRSLKTHGEESGIWLETTLEKDNSDDLDEDGKILD